MPVKLDGEPWLAPTLLGGFGKEMIRNTTLSGTISHKTCSYEL